MKIEIKLSKIPLLVPRGLTVADGLTYGHHREPDMELVPKGIAVLVLDVGDTVEDHAHLMDQADGFLRKALHQAVPDWERRLIELTEEKAKSDEKAAELDQRIDDTERELRECQRMLDRHRDHRKRMNICVSGFSFGKDGDQMRRLVKRDPEAIS